MGLTVSPLPTYRPATQQRWEAGEQIWVNASFPPSQGHFGSLGLELICSRGSPRWDRPGNRAGLGAPGCGAGLVPQLGKGSAGRWRKAGPGQAQLASGPVSQLRGTLRCQLPRVGSSGPQHAALTRPGTGSRRVDFSVLTRFSPLPLFQGLPGPKGERGEKVSEAPVQGPGASWGVCGRHRPRAAGHSTWPHGPSALQGEPQSLATIYQLVNQACESAIQSEWCGLLVRVPGPPTPTPVRPLSHPSRAERDRGHPSLA